MARKSITYRGDQTAAYDRETGTGLVGKVVGAGSRWFVVTSASYDAEADRTHAIVERIASPETVLNRQVGP